MATPASDGTAAPATPESELGPTRVGHTKDSPLVTIERVVALLTPVFAGAAGWLFTVLGKAIPGISIPHDQFVTVFVTGAVLATTASLTWLFGRQKWTHVTHVATEVSGQIRTAVQAATAQVPQLRQIEAALEAHEAAVVTAVANRVGASAAATDVAREIVGQLWPSHQPADAAVVDPAPVVPPSAS